MDNARKTLAVIAIALIFCSGYAYATQLSTTMTWIVASAKSHAIEYSQSCSATAFFFLESKAVLDNDTDGNASQILPYNDRAGTAACQAAGTAPMIISNTGTVTTNIDANFLAAFDTNTWLKVWMGTGAGCGTAGLGGWELICSLTHAATTPVTTTTCKDFNSSQWQNATRLTSGLEIGDTNQLCFSGEMRDAYIHTFPAAVSGAVDHNATFRTSTDVS